MSSESSKLLSDMASAFCASFALPGIGDMLSRAAVFESTGCATMISLEYPGAEVLSIIVVADFHVVVDVLIFPDGNGEFKTCVIPDDQPGR